MVVITQSVLVDPLKNMSMYLLLGNVVNNCDE